MIVADPLTIPEAAKTETTSPPCKGKGKSSSTLAIACHTAAVYGYCTCIHTLAGEMKMA
jgi:hypothetical protein